MNLSLYSTLPVVLTVFSVFTPQVIFFYTHHLQTLPLIHNCPEIDLKVWASFINVFILWRTADIYHASFKCPWNINCKNSSSARKNDVSYYNIHNFRSFKVVLICVYRADISIHTKLFVSVCTSELCYEPSLS